VHFILTRGYDISISEFDLAKPDLDYIIAANHGHLHWCPLFYEGKYSSL